MSGHNNREVPPDLHAEPGKFASGFCALGLIVLPAVLFWLSALAQSEPRRLTMIDAPLLTIVPSSEIVRLPAPTPTPAPPPAPAPKPKPKPKPAPLEAELALKQTQVSLKAEAERREEEARQKKKREEEEKKREEEKRRKDAEEKAKREAEKKQREEEEQKKKKEEERKRQEEAKKKKREEEEEQRRKDQEAEEKIRAAEDQAAELRAQVDAQARAAELERQAELRSVYGSRIILQIERQLDTPIHLLNRDDIKALVEVRLHPDGELRGWPKISQSSGFPEYDEAAIRAVIQAAPLTLPDPNEEPELVREFLRLNLLVCNDPDSPHCKR